MTDRELLELAAKAVKLPECGWMGPAFMYVKNNQFTDWNPLTDDGDALRLAVKLSMDVDCTDNGNHVSNTWAMSQQSTGSGCSEYHNTDPYAATRRAIVRAAAEVGKEKTE